MKTKILISLFFILPVVVFYFSQPDAKETDYTAFNSSVQPDSFLIGSTANGSYQDYAGYKKANMNLWHIYEGGSDVIGGKWYPAGWVNIGAPNDRLFSDSSQYIGDVQNILRTNADNGLTSNMMRPKIEYLSYGQHSDYQCEVLPEDPVNNATDWFYSYREHGPGNDVDDNQPTKVRLCEVNDPNHQAGYVVRNLKANRELCNEDDLRVNTDHIYDWYFLPQIKIPQGLNNNTQVCRIDVVSWEDEVLKSWELTAGSFLDSNLSYSGEYIHEFNLRNLGYEPMTINVSENLLFNPNKHGWTDVNTNCKFDIRVYWYKQCDMWIDYIRVENEVAYELFKGNHDDWIGLEARQVGGYAAGAPHKFYIEEVEYNSFPCIKYVNEKIKQYNPNMSLVCVPYLAAPPMNGGVWYNFNKEKIKSVYQYLGMTEFYMSYYPLHGNYCSLNNYGVPSYIPNTFPNCVYNNCEYDLRYGNLGVRVPINTYEENLQDLLDNHELFIDNGLKTAEYISEELDIPFIFMEQAHLWLNNSLPGNEKYSQREPTNEELEVMADIALTYGAKGISYFAYDSWGPIGTPNIGAYYSYGRGLMKFPASALDTSKRDTNVYGQNKWQKIVDLNAKLKRWGPYLVSFDVDYSHSYIYHNSTERNNLLTNSYINDIVTYKQSFTNPDCQEDGPGVPNPPNMVFDCKDDRYLQVATFKKNLTDTTKYLMIVNRRCSPFINDNSENERGGLRYIKIGFDVNSNELTAGNNWLITDLDSNKPVAVFDKRSSALIELGWFKPGEGKLYSLSPEMD